MFFKHIALHCNNPHSIYCMLILRYIYAILFSYHSITLQATTLTITTFTQLILYISFYIYFYVLHKQAK